MRLIVTGGAPLARHVEDFLKVAMCCPVVQGYGLTETCAASFICTPDVHVSYPEPFTVITPALEPHPHINTDYSADPATESWSDPHARLVLIQWRLRLTRD